MVKKRIFMIFISLLLCITASFAWILEKEKIIVDSVVLDYDKQGTITIAPENIIMELWLQKDGSDDAELISTTKDELEPQSLVSIKNVIPNKNVSFIIRLQNISKNMIQISLSIPDFRCSEKLMPENNGVIEMRTYPGTSYANYPAAKKPEEKYVSLTRSLATDLGDGSYSISLYDSIFVPPTGKYDYVDIRCSFYFSPSMDNSYQGLDFKIMSLRALEI